MEGSIAELWDRVMASGLATSSSRPEWFSELSDLSSDADAYDAVQCWLRTNRLTAFQSQELLEASSIPLAVGHYVFLEKIGHGGMGAVFRARHRMMKRDVAVKLILPHRLGSREVIERFRREVATSAQLEHPRIVRAYDAGETNGVHWLAMELVDGQDLATVIRENGPMACEQAVACIVQAADALAFAHDRGIIHRDIKPGNLLLDKSGNLKVLDLGLAITQSPDETPLTRPGQMMGTVDYIAPEQARNGRAADARSDIYALGMTLWTLLTDTVPYAGSQAAKLLAHLHQPAPDLLKVCPTAPAALVQAYQKMVAKDPQHRFQTMREVEQLLSSIVGPPSPSTPIQAEGSKTAEERIPSSDSATPGQVAVLDRPEQVTAPEAQPAPSWRSWQVAAIAIVLCLAVAVALWIFLR
jgi:serine/threonine protein kinase